jgi:hypothetical protein
MKKILIISLFGLFAAQESTAMFERAVKSAEGSGISERASVFLDNVKKASDALAANQSQSLSYKDISQVQADQIWRDYNFWAVNCNTKHARCAASLRSDSKKASLDEIQSSHGSARDCDEKEKKLCASVLKKYGYSPFKADHISNKIVILHSDSKRFGSYYSDEDNNTEAILITEDVLSGIKKLNINAIFSLLHETEHYNYWRGHKHFYISSDSKIDLLLDQVNEERRAEIEAMRKLSVRDIQKLPNVSRESILNGYVSGSKRIRDFVIKEKKSESKSSTERA